MNRDEAFAVEAGWTAAYPIAHTLGPAYRLLRYPDGTTRFEHRCDRGERGVIICAPALRPEHVVTESDGKITVTPSILCPDCGTHGFVTESRWSGTDWQPVVITHGEDGEPITRGNLTASEGPIYESGDNELIEQPPEDLAEVHVIDRTGLVWRIVRDGGMATRAHYAGIVSIGIATLEREAGPLVTLAARDRVVAATAAETAQTSLDRVAALHTQTSDLGMAPGKWCPACGHETPCPTILATLTPPPYLGHLSREELRQRAMDYDEAEETAQRLRETDALAAAAHPDEESKP